MAPAYLGGVFYGGGVYKRFVGQSLKSGTGAEGLLAEFRRELDEVVLRDYSGPLSMELERDEGLRRELAERELLLDLIFGGGRGGGGEATHEWGGGGRGSPERDGIGGVGQSSPRNGQQ